MTKSTRKKLFSERGVALLMVLLSVSLLLGVTTRFAYESFIDYQLARNARDRAQAYYNARSGLEVYKLILSADKQITGNEQLKQAAAGFGINTEAYGLWQMLPELDTRLIRGLVDPSMSDEDKEAIREMFGGAALDFVAGSESFLDFDGDFSARIENEDGKINLNEFPGFHNNVLDSPIGRAIYALTLDEMHDQIFEGTNGLEEKKLSREEVISNIDDWIDSNTEPILYGGGSEDAAYYSYEDEYRARNQRMETLAELAMVNGINDDFMNAFADKLTVWSTGKINVNTAPHEVIAGLFMAYSLDPVTPESADEYAAATLEYRALSPFSKADDFITFARDVLGVELGTIPASQNPTGNNNNNPASTPGTSQGQNVLDVIGVDTKVFKITSTGYAGEARVTITAVVDNTQAASVRFLYWRVD